MSVAAVERRVDCDGFTLHVEVRGTGTPALVLLHGFGASSFTWWAVADRLADHHRVVAFDRFGFGRSDAPRRSDWSGRPNPFTAEAAVRSTLAVLDAVGLEKAVLVGSSAGGTVALSTALAAPDRVEALVLVDTPLAEGPPPAVARAFALPFARAAAPFVLHAGRRFAGRGLRLAWHEPAAIPAHVLDGYRAAWNQPGWAAALVEMTLATQPSGLASRLPELRLPVLVVAGAHDRIVPRDDTRALAGGLVSGRMAFVDDAGHLPHEEQPEAFLAVVEPFLAGLTNDGS